MQKIFAFDSYDERRNRSGNDNLFSTRDEKCVHRCSARDDNWLAECHVTRVQHRLACQGALVTVKICVFCGFWFLNQFDIMSEPPYSWDTFGRELTVSCFSDLFKIKYTLFFILACSPCIHHDFKNLHEIFYNRSSVRTKFMLYRFSCF